MGAHRAYVRRAEEGLQGGAYAGNDVAPREGEEYVRLPVLQPDADYDIEEAGTSLGYRRIYKTMGIRKMRQRRKDIRRARLP